LLASLLFIGACTTVNVDQIKLSKNLGLAGGDAVVVMGRHHSAEFETEYSLVNCVGDKLRQNKVGIVVIPERQFADQFYPWFEARTAPLHPLKMRKILEMPLVASKIENLNIRYFVWVEGSTERTAMTGTMSCGIGAGGAGCFGFGAWEDTSEYETAVWDMQKFKEVGRISTDAVGNSYMPAFIIPIPLLAGVEKDACEGMGNQLINFFDSNTNTVERQPSN
jgi:hypothetical protein